jgi:hypothetical protein
MDANSYASADRLGVRQFALWRFVPNSCSFFRHSFVRDERLPSSVYTRIGIAEFQHSGNNFLVVRVEDPFGSEPSVASGVRQGKTGELNALESDCKITGKLVLNARALIFKTSKNGKNCLLLSNWRPTNLRSNFDQDFARLPFNVLCTVRPNACRCRCEPAAGQSRFHQLP